jgi:hypothetical protein
VGFPTGETKPLGAAARSDAMPCSMLIVLV